MWEVVRRVGEWMFKMLEVGLPVKFQGLVRGGGEESMRFGS